MNYRGNEQAFPRHEKHFDGITVREYMMAHVLPALVSAKGGQPNWVPDLYVQRAAELVEKALAATQAADTNRGPHP